MTYAMPEGFVLLPSDKTPFIRFDVQMRRFYLTKDLFKTHGLSHKDYVGLAYNKQSKQFLIDKFGRTHYIDARGYVTSARLKEEVHRSHGNDPSIQAINFAYNEEMSNARFIVFDEVTTINR